MALMGLLLVLIFENLPFCKIFNDPFVIGETPKDALL